MRSLKFFAVGAVTPELFALCARVPRAAVPCLPPCCSPAQSSKTGQREALLDGLKVHL